MKKLLSKLMGDKYSDQAAKYAIINYSIVAIMFITSAIMLMLGLLPQQMPMQWNLQGEVNRYLPSAFGVWIIPSITLFFCVKSTLSGELNIFRTFITAALCIIMIAIYIFVM